MARLGEPQQKAERCSHGNAQQKPFTHPNQAVVGKQADTLVHFAAFLERLEDVDLALLPGLSRRGQISGNPGACCPPDAPDQEHACHR